MGSDTDYPVMSETGKILDKFGIGYEVRSPGCFKENHGHLEFGESGQVRLLTRQQYRRHLEP